MRGAFDWLARHELSRAEKMLQARAWCCSPQAWKQSFLEGFVSGRCWLVTSNTIRLVRWPRDDGLAVAHGRPTAWANRVLAGACSQLDYPPTFYQVSDYLIVNLDIAR